MPAAACIRYLRSGGGVGCQAKPSTTGILYLVSDQSDVARFASTAPTAGYAVVMPDNIETLQESGKLAAIILVKNGLNFDRPDQWSPDTTCPNCQYGLYGNQSEETWHLWNPNGNSLFFDKYEFPIFGVSTDSTNPQRIDPLVSAVNANKLHDYSSYPLYAVEFDAFMYAAVDSETCLRRGECEPVGGLSVWSTFSHNYLENNVDAKKPVVVVSSKLDGRAFIHDWGPLSSSPIYSVGANSPKTGLVTALAVAEALSKYFGEPGAVPLAKDILFTFFDAESWAFAGSQRFVDDISTPMTCKEREAPTTSCPTSDAGCSNPCFYDLDFQAIKLENIDSIFEFDTVGGIGTTKPAFYMHVDAKNAETDALVNLLNGTVVAPAINGSTAESLDLVPAFQTGVNARLPPSSAMAFLAKRSIPAVVISDYQNEFSNRYYNSEFDDETTWDTSTISRMCALANKTAQAVYQRASGNQTVPASIAADCHQVRDDDA
ncbi:hypothetical protein PhCBS80983_g05290 [Powellomyces hirtus]|uniref:Nicastrin n=1 Tax=Powellomyces hirtus TaxID=109895 RepID=A0A507DV76_9FUNG|nr:hypothetical protein PhCBS80983_g05290 [Powellomyces hirtus]